MYFLATSAVLGDKLESNYDGMDVLLEQPESQTTTMTPR